MDSVIGRIKKIPFVQSEGDHHRSLRSLENYVRICLYIATAARKLQTVAL